MNDLPDLIADATCKAWNQGSAHEQQRIIKLLEESDSVCNDWAIALIKGENK